MRRSAVKARLSPQIVNTNPRYDDGGGAVGPPPATAAQAPRHCGGDLATGKGGV